MSTGTHVWIPWLAVLIETDGCRPSTVPSTRRSALKARKAINPRSAWATNAASSHFMADKAIHSIKRRRKARNISLRELGAADEEHVTLRSTLARSVDTDGHAGTVCPVCLKVMRGDEDVVDAHVDSCLAHAARMQEEMERAEAEAESDIDIDRDGDAWEDVEVEGEMRLRRTGAGNFRGEESVCCRKSAQANKKSSLLEGTGFHVRDGNQQDVEGEVDVDGDDEEVFGDVQFTESDVVTYSPREQPAPVADSSTQSSVEADHDVEDDEDALRALVAAGKVIRRRTPPDNIAGVKAKMEEVMGVGEADRVDAAVLAARRVGSKASLINALEEKIKLLVSALSPLIVWITQTQLSHCLDQESTRISSSTSSSCRICLDPYTEPTASTGCWHTCCRECWLRCLGSTKLCPMCKRITQASELRRIYL